MTEHTWHWPSMVVILLGAAGHYIVGFAIGTLSWIGTAGRPRRCRVRVKGTAIDVYTVVGCSQAGYSHQEIADELLPQLRLEQVQATLRYYAEYPDEIDRFLAQGKSEAVKAQLYRSLGPEGYRRLTSLSGEPRVIREARARYEDMVVIPTIWLAGMMFVSMALLLLTLES